jgi:putative membrane protein
MLQLTLVGALIFAVGIAIFAVQNTTPVPVHFLGWRSDALAASVLVLISAALGAATTLLFGVAREVKLRLRLRSQGKQLSTSQDRVHELEVPPTGDAAAT